MPKEIFVLGPSSSYALWDLRTSLIHQGLELDVQLVELVVRWRCRVSVVMGHTIGKLYSLTGQISLANIRGVLQNPNYSYPALHLLNFRNLFPYKFFTIPSLRHTHTHKHTCTRTYTHTHTHTPHLKRTSYNKPLFGICCDQLTCMIIGYKASTPLSFLDQVFPLVYANTMPDGFQCQKFYIAFSNHCTKLRLCYTHKIENNVSFFL